jgi:hypothetical protein
MPSVRRIAASTELADSCFVSLVTTNRLIDLLLPFAQHVASMKELTFRRHSEN